MRHPRLGSVDEVDYEIPRFSWVKFFKYMTNKYVYIIMVTLDLLGCVFPYINAIILGSLSEVILDNTYVTAESFLEDLRNLSTILIIFILLFIVSIVGRLIMEFKFLVQFKKDLNMVVMNAILKQDTEFFDNYKTGILLSRLTSDVPNVFSAVSTRIIFITRNIVQFITGCIVSFTSSWKASLVVLCIMPLSAFENAFARKKMDKSFVEQNNKGSEVTVKAEEILTSMRTIRSFDAEAREYFSFKQKMYDEFAVTKRLTIIFGIRGLINTVLLWGMTSLVMLITGKQAARGEIAPSQVVSLFTIINNWNFSLSAIVSHINEFKKSNVAAGKLLKIIEHEPKIRLGEGRKINNVHGRLTFENVTFCYPSRDDPAIRDMSFEVNPGETVAIVGESGCGKSTTLSLIQRLYDVNEGSIKIDGIDIREIDPCCLRRFVSFVPQSPVLFTMSLKDNIRFGMPDAPREKVIEASEIANAAQFINQLDQGYDTPVQQMSLSGGQKQRVCIARSVLMDAPVLLLDEATAALDTESERLVQEALTNFKTGRTVVIVAHRLATIRHASKILVMDEGRIVESGTHEELLARDGRYAYLIRNQLQ